MNTADKPLHPPSSSGTGCGAAPHGEETLPSAWSSSTARAVNSPAVYERCVCEAALGVGSAGWHSPVVTGHSLVVPRAAVPTGLALGQGSSKL